MADMSNIDSEKIYSAANQLDGILQKIGNTVGKFSDAIDNLDKGWSSEVKAGFMDTYHNDREAMNEMLDQLQEFSGSLREVASDFDKTENEALSAAKALK